MKREHRARTLQPLTSLEQLDHVFSIDAPVLVFKHSPTCGISAQAYDEICGMLDKQLPLAAAYLILVGQHRDVSREVATRTSIRHESPQALLLAGGKVRWHASHFRVTAERVAAAVGQISDELSLGSELPHSNASDATPKMIA